MDIIERYVCSYVMICAGVTGNNDSYIHEIVSAGNIRTESPFLKKVLEIVEDGGDTRSKATQQKVRDLLRGKLEVENGNTPPVRKSND